MFIQKVYEDCIIDEITSFIKSITLRRHTCTVTNWGEAGLGWRPARPTTAYQGFSKNRHNPVMVYNDLMIRHITVHNYNKDRSQPVTIQCIYTWVGAGTGRPTPVDRDDLLQPCSDLGLDYSSFLLYGF